VDLILLCLINPFWVVTLEIDTQDGVVTCKAPAGTKKPPWIELILPEMKNSIQSRAKSNTFSRLTGGGANVIFWAPGALSTRLRARNCIREHWSTSGTIQGGLAIEH
jgi:hypothetical protein